jgi:phosphatidate cytidylyltransferase
MAALASSAPARAPQSSSSRRFRGLATRAVSAAVLAPPVLAALWFGYPWFDLVAALAAPIMVAEWLRLTRGRGMARVMAMAYVAVSLVALLWLRHQPIVGRMTVIWLIACVWATDIGAYFLGSIVGGAKLAPRISPSKTWSGLIGGMCWAAVASAALGLLFQQGTTLELVFAGLGLAGISQIGDLVESAAKRDAGVKDSGHLIPGHGGLLDRVDGLMAATVAVAMVRLVAGSNWPWS